MRPPQVIINETARLMSLHIERHHILCALKSGGLKLTKEEHDNVISVLMCMVHYVKVLDLRDEIRRLIFEHNPAVLDEYDSFTTAYDKEYKNHRDMERESTFLAKKIIEKVKSL